MKNNRNTNAVRKVRDSLGMTQVQFAKIVGVTKSAVSNWENGREPSGLAKRAIEKIANKRNAKRVKPKPIR